MADPNPIWGLHAVPGAIAGALVLRVGDGFQILDTFVVQAPEDMAGVRAAVGEVLERPGVAGRAAMIAIGDHELAIGTGTIPSD